MANPLFSEYDLAGTPLDNRIVMAPMTRCRAIDNLPNDLMATYYGQRSGAGLIITEGVAPSPNALGYARIPGAWSDAQTAGWRKTADAVHEEGGRIFMQLMHTGRVSHPGNMPEGARILAPSSVPFDEAQMWVDEAGAMLDMPAAEEMTAEDIESTIEEFVTSARNAIAAGFDGVEIHAANGYLVEQFIHPHTNRRDDEWGGSVDARLRFAFEVTRRVVEAIGKDRVGVRVSPYGVFNEMPHYPEIDETYEKMASTLSEMGIAYLHVLDHSDQGAPEVPQATKDRIRELFDGAMILCGGFDGDAATAAIEAGRGDLIAFGRPFTANPDLPTRIEEGADLAEPRTDLFYMPGEEGYTDYPTLDEA